MEHNLKFMEKEMQLMEDDPKKLKIYELVQ